MQTYARKTSFRIEKMETSLNLRKLSIEEDEGVSSESWSQSQVDECLKDIYRRVSKTFTRSEYKPKEYRNEQNEFIVEDDEALLAKMRS